MSAAEQTVEEYWKMRAWLFTQQEDLGPNALIRYAANANLDQANFLESITTRKHEAEIREDVAAARAAGITGTPSFVLGTSTGQIITGERITGSKSYQIFDRKIQALLAKTAAPPHASQSYSKGVAPHSLITAGQD
jgi:predicted DsbA family dithiol-disulfide isomerase